MFLLTDEKIDGIIGYRRTMMIGGAGWVGLVSLLPWGYWVGVLTAFMLIFAGAVCGALEEWRSESYVWMVATIFALLCGLSYGYFEFLLLESFLNAPPAVPAAPPSWGGIQFACDVVIGLTVLGKIVRFAVSVAVRNWHLTHEPESLDE